MIACKRHLHSSIESLQESQRTSPLQVQNTNNLSMPTRFTYTLTALLLLSHACYVMAAEEGHDDHDDDHAEELPHSTDTSAVWGYSFLFTIIAQLPSALAIVVCMWKRVSVADTIITNLMALACGVKPSRCAFVLSRHNICHDANSDPNPNPNLAAHSDFKLLKPFINDHKLT